MASNEGTDFRAGLRLSEQSHQIVDGGILTQSLLYEEFSTDIDESIDFPLGRVYGRRTRYNATDAAELRVLRAEPHGHYTHVGTYTRFRDFGDESFGVYCRAFPSRD